MAETAPRALPAELHRHFWDHAAAALRWPADGAFIVLRLLQDGGMDAIRWLLANVGDAGRGDALRRRRGRGIDPRRLRFWGLILDLPREEVDAWVATERPRAWNRRVPR